jgi:DNA-binding IclR family transcriptional regulator
MEHRKTPDSRQEEVGKVGGVAAVNRALAILDAFTKERPAFTLAQLADHTGLYKSTLLRLAESLEHFGYLLRSESGVFTLGVAPMRLTALYQKSLHPAEIVMPVLRQLVAITSESAALYVRASDKRLCAYRVASPRAVSDNVQQGELLPLNRGAGGHVLLAFSGQRGSIYDEARRRMCAVTLGDRDHETAAVARPVFGLDQKLEGALSLSGPIQRFTPDTVGEMSQALFFAARKLTAALGGDPEIYDNHNYSHER